MPKTAEYPSEVPSDSILTLVRIGRGGLSAIARERALFGKSLWITQGYVQKQALGEPVSVVGAESPEASADLGSDTFTDSEGNVRTSLTDEEGFAALESIAAESSGQVAQALPIPASLILGWLIQKGLELLLKKIS